MINYRSLVCTGVLALLMTAPAFAWQGEGRDHGPGYQTYRQSGGGDQGGGDQGGRGWDFGWNSGSQKGSSNGKGSGWLGGGGGSGNGGTRGAGGHGISHSAPGPELGVGLSGIIFGGYLWYRRRARQRRKLSGESKD